MIITGISLLMVLLFGGNPQAIFVVENLQKEVKSNISDEKRKKEILLLLNNYREEVKELQIDLNKNKKHLKKLNLIKETPEDSLLKIINLSIDTWEEIQLIGVPYRLQIQNLILPHEWRKIIANSENDLENKSLQKITLAIEQELSELELIIIKNISDPFRATEALKAYEQFADKMRTLSKENIEIAKRRLDAFYNHQAKKQELENAILSINVLKPEVFEELSMLHHVLFDYTTKEEWHKIAKEVNKHY